MYAQSIFAPCSVSGTDFVVVSYNKKAAIAARIAPALTIVVAAPPVKGVWVGDTGVVVLVLLPLVELADTRVKLAQVRRVVLLVWITMERLPKKDPGPSAVDS